MELLQLFKTTEQYHFLLVGLYLLTEMLRHFEYWK